jgi:hypothetical protein
VKPREAVKYVQRRSENRYFPAAVLRALRSLDVLRSDVDAVDAVEQIIGLIARGMVGSRGPYLDGMATAIHARVLTTQGQAVRADSILRRYLRGSELSPGVVAVLEGQHGAVLLHSFRFNEAEALAIQSVNRFNGREDLPFGGALASRLLLADAWVGSYLYGGGDISVLFRVVETTRHVLATKNPALVTFAADTLVCASACLAMAGESVELPSIRTKGRIPGSIQAAKSRWSHALLDCARAGVLTLSAERDYRIARDVLAARASWADVVLVSVDFGYWLAMSGRWADARRQSEWIRRHMTVLPTSQGEAVALWLAYVQGGDLPDREFPLIISRARRAPYCCSLG